MGCFPGACGGCGPAAYNCDNCDGYGRPMVGGPLRRVGAALSCGSGCGEVYVGEWRNYPPNPCDPCESIGGCRPILSGLRNLFGYRTHECETCYGGDGLFLSALGPGCASCGGCDTGCGETGCGVDASYPSGGGGCSSCGLSSRVSPQAPVIGSRSVANGNVRMADASSGNVATRSMSTGNVATRSMTTGNLTTGNMATRNMAPGNRPVFRDAPSGNAVQNR